MQRTPYRYWMKLTAFISLPLMVLVGCDSGDEGGSSTSSFNLLTLESSSRDVKKLTLTWANASADTNVTYRVCEKNTSKESNCNELTRVTDKLNATVSISSLVDALSTDYFIIASTSSGETVLSNEKNLSTATVAEMIGYFKASNTGTDDGFGHRIALSGDGSILAVGARDEDNGVVGVVVDGSETSDSSVASNSGAVYIFSNESGYWKQVAYVKASNAGGDDYFGYSLSLSLDGSVLAVGAPYEDNGTTGVINDGSETIDSGTAVESGAVYLFNGSSGSWVQTHYFKASNAGDSDEFGRNVALSGDGRTLAVTALGEDNGASGVITDGSETTDTGSKVGSGAVYLFSNQARDWEQVAYVKASNTDNGDFFGYSLALNEDGNTLAVSARDEDNGASGVITDGSEVVDSSTELQSGAVYVFDNTAGGWAQSTYLKASNVSSGDTFGRRVALSGDGAVLAVGSWGEDNGAKGIITNGSELSDSGLAPDSGAVYVFSKNSGAWVQAAYVKASNAGSSDYFGSSVVLSQSGTTMAIGSYGEDNGYVGVVTDGSEMTDYEAKTNSGAIYLFKNEAGSWAQTAFIKASNAGIGDFFGASVAMSVDGSVIAVGANNEDNGATGVITNGSETSDTGAESNSGAVYLY
ncbi:hypothetical protein AB6E04_20160 [Vibrio amylolyticus]|uniref:hypothetical protein n=1 Tax=Vibrio amylolyticus TaxID=2847292 RepID=UPI00354FB76F